MMSGKGGSHKLIERVFTSLPGKEQGAVKRHEDGLKIKKAQWCLMRASAEAFSKRCSRRKMCAGVGQVFGRGICQAIDKVYRVWKIW